VRLAFEIILALPALPFAAAIFIGWRHRRKLKEEKRFEPRIEPGFLRISNLRFQISNSQRRVPSVANKSSLSESEFEQRLIQVEQLRATGHHAAAARLPATAIGGQMQKSE
jgi:hypothetical protein